MTDYQLHHLPNKKQWLEFSNPVDTISAVNSEQVLPALLEVQARVESETLYAAGWLGYAAATGLDPNLEAQADQQQPLLKFSLYKRPAVLTELPVDLFDLGQSGDVEKDHPQSRLIDLGGFDHGVYRAAIAQIKALLRRGDSYQVNYTQQLTGRWRGGSAALFRHLLAAQPQSYAAYLVDDERAICSVSPELFFSLDGDEIRCRPMKGTARRGRFMAEDREAAEKLRASVKDQAENLMIVDMVRNDLGRIAETGSIKVEQLFNLEQYPTVWQLTSTIAARTGADLVTIFQALFPCASIVGAPKRRTMQIIKDLEQGPRGLYTGAIGWMGPGRQAQFNVAIRTAQITTDHLTTAGQPVSYGVGGGIVWDSKADLEAQECIDKSKVLVEAPTVGFRLLETLRWSPAEGYWLLSEHLLRIKQSAEYFLYEFDQSQLLALLRQATAGFNNLNQRVRVTLTKQGQLEISHQPLQLDPLPVKLALFDQPVPDFESFRYHKTDPRPWLDGVPAPGSVGADDWVFSNVAGHLTETTIANLVIEHDGAWLTPPVESGLLPGTYRQRLLGTGVLREQIITPRMLEQASAIGLINSVRGWRSAILLPTKTL